MEPCSNNRNSQDEDRANGLKFIDILLCKLEGTYLPDEAVGQSCLFPDLSRRQCPSPKTKQLSRSRAKNTTHASCVLVGNARRREHSPGQMDSCSAMEIMRKRVPKPIPPFTLDMGIKLSGV